MRKTLFIILNLFLFANVMTLSAQDIRLGPPIVEIVTTPASTQNFYLSIINQSITDIECSISISSMTMTEAGVPVPADTAERSAASWIKMMDDPNFVLKADETRRLQFLIRPPLKTEPGGYYSMILAKASNVQQVIGNQTKAQATLRIRFQMASVVMTIVKGANVSAKIEPEAPIIFGGNRLGQASERNWYVKLPVRNDGNIHVALEGNVQILSEAGQTVREQGLIAGRGYLLPKQRRVFKAEGNGPLPDGVYIADIKVGQLNIKKFASERVPFYILSGQVYPGTPGQTELSNLEQTTQGFILNTTELELVAAPGGRRTQMVQITNLTNRELQITSSIHSWDQMKNGDIYFPARTKHGRELKSSEITISPNTFTLKPKAKMGVKLLFTLPKDAKGEYFNAIVFNRVGLELPKAPSLLLTQSVLTSIKATKTEQVIGEFIGFEAIPVKNKGTNFNIVLKNLGNVSFSPEGRLSIFNSQNERVGDVIVFGQNSFILPNNEREIIIEWGHILPTGRYRAEVTIIENIDRSRPLKKEFNFNLN